MHIERGCQIRLKLSSFDSFDPVLRQGGYWEVDNLSQKSSGAHRAQGTNWLGWIVGGCRFLMLVLSKIAKFRL